jgi:tRNA-specific 2-thiouridylase
MSGEKKKVIVAMSGGVDSSTAAALLLDAGYECCGAFMITNNEYQRAQADAEVVARKLGIELNVLEVRQDFEHILDYFCSEYARGRTPNPCILCNRHIKFGKLWDFGRRKGADLLATGHYARIVKHNSSAELYEAADAAKDQSYVLSMVNKEVLRHVILPMGGHSKDDTRRLAAKFGLGVEHRTESQEICFIPDNDYAAVLEQRCPELVRPGKIIDSSGKLLGEHNGVHRFTVGQRRGVRVALGKPYYVVEIDAESNIVTLGPKEEVMQSGLSASGVNWLSDKPGSAFRAKVRIRYNDRGAAAWVTPQGDNAAVEFDQPKSAITPGQLAVFYVSQADSNRVVGAGWIERATDKK